jgi:hypothetical protein
MGALTEESSLDAISIVHPGLVSILHCSFKQAKRRTSNSQVTAGDAEKLPIPLGIYCSKDESKEEVRHLCSLIGRRDPPVSTALSLIRLWKNFRRSHLPIRLTASTIRTCACYILTFTPNANNLPSGSTVGLLLEEISQIPKTNKNTRTYTLGLLHSSRRRSPNLSTNTRTKFRIVRMYSIVHINFLQTHVRRENVISVGSVGISFFSVLELRFHLPHP